MEPPLQKKKTTLISLTLMARVGNLGKGGIGGVVGNNRGDRVLGFLQSFMNATNNLMEFLSGPEARPQLPSRTQSEPH